MKDVAIVGLPFSGKSTVWEAVSRGHAQAGGRKANLAVVSVPDPRVDALAGTEGSKKLTYSQVRLVDTAGLDAQSLHAAREADALAVVLRAFGDDPDPARDLLTFRAELAVADLQTLEKATERARKQAKSGAKEAKDELAVCERAEAVLSEDRWLAEERWEPEEFRVLKLLTLLTVKPVLHVINTDETGAEPPSVPEPRVLIRGLLEAEAAELPESDAASLLAEYGVEASATKRFVRSVYDLLGLVTFLTTGPTESRAWEVPSGTKAPQAAGTIHSDLERGFIRAETVAFDDLMGAGSFDAAKAKGLVRLEGKDYEVKEGDVLLIRHAS